MSGSNATDNSLVGFKVSVPLSSNLSMLDMIILFGKKILVKDIVLPQTEIVNILKTRCCFIVILCETLVIYPGMLNMFHKNCHFINFPLDLKEYVHYNLGNSFTCINGVKEQGIVNFTS